MIHRDNHLSKLSDLCNPSFDFHIVLMISLEIDLLLNERPTRRQFQHIYSLWTVTNLDFFTSSGSKWSQMRVIIRQFDDFSYAFWFFIPSTFLNSFWSFKAHASDSIWNFIDVLIAIRQKTLWGSNTRIYFVVMNLRNCHQHRCSRV